MTLNTKKKIGMSKSDKETVTKTPDLLHYDLGEEVVAFSSRRGGGVSEGNYASFNINGYCGDNTLHIAANRKLLCDYLQIEPSSLVMPHQTHSTRVKLIDEAIMNLSPLQRTATLEGVDALITAERGICIGVSTADCIPVLLFDPVHQVIAAVHAGWRGTVGRIVVETLSELFRTFQTSASDLRVAIGPGISGESFEVGNEVYETFVSAGFPMDRLAVKKTSIRNTAEQSWYIDLWEANRMQLESRGVLPENIQMAGICTYQNSDEFFSARRLGINSGRIFNGIMLKK